MSVTVGTLNVGNAGNERVARDIERMVDVAGVVALQEMGDRDKALAMLPDWISVYRGAGRGASSTPIAWDNRRWRREIAHTRPLTPPTNAGKLGAGPTVVKAKVANAVVLQRVRDDGKAARRITVVSIHAPASQWAPGRRKLTRRWAAQLATVTRSLPGVVFFAGDFNAKPAASTLRALRGFRSAQVARRRPTHGRRPIDDVRAKGKRWRCVAARTIDTSSDHRGLITTWQPRRRGKREKP